MKFFYLNHFLTIVIFTIASSGCKHSNFNRQTGYKGNTFYLTADGSDANSGTKTSPWKSIEKLNSIRLLPGDTVCFQADQTFTGNLLLDSTDRGTKENSVIITSFGNGKAIIDGGNLTAITVSKTAYVKIGQLQIIGSGRKNGNTRNGVIIMNSSHAEVDNVDISGFQKAGLLVYASQNIEIKDVHARDNGFAGISIAGDNTKESCQHIHITGCSAVNNPGDPTELTNHSGNGIIAGNCKNVLIEYSSATNNGWDMPRIGNGPVGIWTYEADSVIIQYCISYRNKTSAGGGDGGGFDLDGGVTNSIIQHCLSYDNQGSGFGIFQYSGASGWHNNVIRNNISENDGSVSRAGASAFIWNGSGYKNQFKNLRFYNNILYNSKGAVISYDDKESQHTGFRFYNNIFVGKDELINGNDTIENDIFLRNNWWSLKSGFNMQGIKEFKTWILKTGTEQENGKIAGYNEDPQFKNAGKALLTEPHDLKLFSNYNIPENSKLINNLPAY